MTFHVGDKPDAEQRALLSKIGSEFERSMERLAGELDSLAPVGILGTEWLALVEHALGDEVTTWYGDWMAEVWESESYAPETQDL